MPRKNKLQPATSLRVRVSHLRPPASHPTNYSNMRCTGLNSSMCTENLKVSSCHVVCSRSCLCTLERLCEANPNLSSSERSYSVTPLHLLLLTNVTLLQVAFFLLSVVGPCSAKIKHVILFSDRFRLLFFHFSIVMCFFMTKSVLLTCCAPLILMGARYYYSRKVIQNYLDCALHTDMADIEAYYMKPTGKTLEEPAPSSLSCELLS